MFCFVGRATNIAYVGPSVTPYDNLNPGYRIYYVDGDHDSTTRLVIDHENWIMNLKEANLYDYPIWYKLYSTRLAYSMRGLRPQDWDELINTMTNNEEMFDLYYKYVPFSSTRNSTSATLQIIVIFIIVMSKAHCLRFAIFSGIIGKIHPYDRNVCLNARNECCVMQKAGVVTIANIFVKVSNRKLMKVTRRAGVRGSIADLVFRKLHDFH